MNGSWDIQRVLVASHQAELRHEADTTRMATDATFAAAAERTRHASDGDTTAHMIGAPRAIAALAARPATQPALAAPTLTACDSSAARNERTLAA